MAWAWGAEYDCGHETGGIVEGDVAYVTPLDLGEERYCPQCKSQQVVARTWGRGR